MWKDNVEEERSKIQGGGSNKQSVAENRIDGQNHQTIKEKLLFLGSPLLARGRSVLGRCGGNGGRSRGGAEGAAASLGPDTARAA